MKNQRGALMLMGILVILSAVLVGCGGGTANAANGNTCAPYAYCMSVVSTGNSVIASPSGFGINYSGTLQFQFTPALPAGNTVNLVFNGSSMYATANTNGNSTLSFQVGGSSLACIFQQNPTTIYAYWANGTQAIATDQITWSGSCP